MFFYRGGGAKGLGVWGFRVLGGFAVRVDGLMVWGFGV